MQEKHRTDRVQTAAVSDVTEPSSWRPGQFSDGPRVISEFFIIFPAIWADPQVYQDGNMLVGLVGLVSLLI
jgi:hypothetical protein